MADQCCECFHTLKSLLSFMRDVDVLHEIPLERFKNSFVNMYRFALNNN